MKAVTNHKHKITRFKLIENVAKALNLTKGQIKAIPNFEFYCETQMRSLGWHFDRSCDEFKRYHKFRKEV